MLQNVFPSCLGHIVALRAPQNLTESSIVGERGGYTCRDACATVRQSSGADTDQGCSYGLIRNVKVPLGKQFKVQYTTL